LAAGFILGWRTEGELESEADWEAAEKVTEGLPEADTSGTVVTWDWTALASGTSYRVAVRAYDDADLLSPLGVSCFLQTTVPTDPDTLAPPAVADLRVTGLGAEWVQLTWSTVSDDSLSDAPVGYEVGVRDGGEISAGDWESLDRLESVSPTHARGGEPQRLRLAGLTPGGDYGIAVRAIDTAGNRAPISNAILVADLHSRPVLPPAAIADLRATHVGTDWIDLRWTAPRAYEPEGAACFYELAVASVPLREADWSALGWPGALPEPGAPGDTEQLRLRPLTPGETYWIAVRAADRLGNRSPLHETLEISTHAVDHQAPPAPGAPLAELRSGETLVRLRWSPVGASDLWGYFVYGRPASETQATRLHAQPLAATSWSFPLPAPGEQYYVSVSAVDASGNEGARGDEAALFASEVQLRGPYPHPIEEQAAFELQLPPGMSGAHVRAVFYSVLGEPVRHWLDAPQTSGGLVRLVWDRRNDAGSRVAPGLYFLRLDAAGRSLTRKIYVAG
ncbi:MAG: hypothetical protein GF330_06685, partial [Candidatus Eisenbacteria bacterium]|nr:hypothetical protein [Candidatus Eisenbacteria bacterium]